MSEWQLIETAPKDGPVLLFEPDPIGTGCVGEGYFSKRVFDPFTRKHAFGVEGWVFNFGEGLTQNICEPTHWMPLPEPPKEG